MKSICFVLESGLISILVGCSSTPVVVAPVGPKPASLEHTIVNCHGGTGFIQVFSDTKEHFIDNDVPYYRHMGYNIYDEGGKRVQYVPNHIGITDESPTRVQLAEGNYNIVAESSAYGRVTVAVVIQADKTTILHLDRGWTPSSNISSNEIVRFPDGEAIGWSCAVTKTSE